MKNELLFAATCLYSMHVLGMQEGQVRAHAALLSPRSSQLLSLQTLGLTTKAYSKRLSLKDMTSPRAGELKKQNSSADEITQLREELDAFNAANVELEKLVIEEEGRQGVPLAKTLSRLKEMRENARQKNVEFEERLVKMEKKSQEKLSQSQEGVLSGRDRTDSWSEDYLKNEDGSYPKFTI